jgi:hypothetical protein
LDRVLSLKAMAIYAVLQGRALDATASLAERFTTD